EVGLVGQGGGIEGVAGALAPQAAEGDTAQLAVNQRQHLVSGRPVAAGPGGPQLGDAVAGTPRRHRGPRVSDCAPFSALWGGVEISLFSRRKESVMSWKTMGSLMLVVALASAFLSAAGTRAVSC